MGERRFPLLLLVLTVCALAMSGIAAQAANLVFSDDFEAGNFNKWLESGDQICTSPVHSGTYAMGFDGYYGTMAVFDPQRTEYDKVFLRFWWYIDPDLVLQTGSGNHFWRLTYAEGDQYQYYQVDTGSYYGADIGYDCFWPNEVFFPSLATLPQGRWFKFETYIDLNTPGLSDGEFRVWIDGVETAHRTNVSLGRNGHNHGINMLEASTNYDTATRPPSGFYWWIDDVEVWDGIPGGGSAPVANFTGSPTSGEAPLTVNFTDTSSNSPTSWSWSFGDGGTSNEQDPSHTYNNAGTYTVSLTATNGYGSDVESKSGYVSVSAGGGGPPEGNGLAASYPGDVGIESDPDVIFVERFEEASTTELAARWDDVRNLPIMSFSGDHPSGSSGSQSLCVTHTSADSGAHLYRSFPAGYEQLYVRFYTKFASAADPIHHFTWLGGYNPPTTWPQGGAGTRPNGNERVTTGFEPMGTAWRWDFYSYYCQMHQSGDLNYWGNDFINDGGYTVPKNEWLCVEGMIKLNNPVNQWNGEQGLWINGTVRRLNGQIVGYLGPGTPRGYWVWDSFYPDPASSPFEGYQFRNDPALKLNFLWLEAYMDPETGTPGTDVWFDDLVLATRYIGPVVSGAAPVANFTGSPTSGTMPLTVYFTDTSTNAPTSWSWTFGDSGTSSAQSPSHLYTAAGSYTVSLTAANAYGNDTETKTNYVTVTVPPPVANFTGAPTSGLAPLTVQFTDTSTNSPTSWSWTFGDSGTSTARNPSHQYLAAGAYTVSLTATNAGGSDGETKTDYITVTAPPPPPVANFTGAPTSGLAPLTVQFTDTSTNSPTSWSWSFGDTGTSTAQNPSHQYTAAGTYTVSLTATNAGGSDGETKNNYITVTSGEIVPAPKVESFVLAAAQPASTSASTIWYDNFDTDRSEYFDKAGVLSSAQRFGGSGSSMQSYYPAGQVSGTGKRHLAFGDCPFGNPVHSGTQYTDVYWRVYVKHMDNWSGSAGNLGKLHGFASTLWNQAFFSDTRTEPVGSVTLTLRPFSGIQNNTVVTTGYQDFAHLTNLGNVVSTSQLCSAAEAGRWIPVEVRTKLNTPGLSDGYIALWIDGRLEAERSGLDFRQSYTARGLNAFFLESWLDAAFAVDQYRWQDDLVISTQPIGPAAATANPSLTKVAYASGGGWEARVSANSAGTDVVWVSNGSAGAEGSSLVVNTTNGTFQGSQAGRTSLSAGTYYCRVRQRNTGGTWSDWSGWHQPFTVTQSTIFSDGFETAFSGWTLTRTPDWFTGTPKNGTHSIQFRGAGTAGEDEAMQRTISTAGKTGIQVSFFMGGNSLDSTSEYIAASWYNGSAWTELKRIRGGDPENDRQLHSYTYSLPAGADNNPNFRVKFALVASGSGDYGYVDDVVVTGAP